MYDCSLIRFTKTCTVPRNVYMLRCVTSSCTLKWNGANDYIYPISEAVCVGEAICWDFVDMVSSMKCNFSAFCFFMNSSYNRHNSARKFMSVKTFIRVFLFLGPQTSALNSGKLAISVAFRRIFWRVMRLKLASVQAVQI